MVHGLNGLKLCCKDNVQVKFSGPVLHLPPVAVTHSFFINQRA